MQAVPEGPQAMNSSGVEVVVTSAAAEGALEGKFSWDSNVVSECSAATSPVWRLSFSYVFFFFLFFFVVCFFDLFSLCFRVFN